jgi:probable HAF family extracellular repeat protein
MKRPSLPAVLIFVVLSLSPLAPAQSYSVTIITATSPSPRAIDSKGDVAGVYVFSKKPPVANAFLWTKSGGLQGLGTLGGDDSIAFGINSSGQVVGQANASTGAPDQAFLWTKSGGMIDLGNLGGASSVANAINASGQVAGQSNVVSGFTHAFLWSQSGGLQDLGVLPGGQQSGANAINSSGEIVGSANIGSTNHAFRWTQSGGMVDLGITVNCDVVALGVNDPGEVVGWFNNSGGCTFTSHGFSWTPSGGLKDLGVLPGGNFSFAYGVNSSEQVVGTGQNSASQPVALLWTVDGAPHDLNTLVSSNTPRTLVAANAINDAGQIVVDATTKTGRGAYALILTPIMNTTLASSQNPSKVGQPVTFTATVSSIAGPPPNGEQVAFKSGPTVLGKGSLAKGVATITTSSLGVGSHKIVATYTGDTIYASSKSATLIQVVTN